MLLARASREKTTRQTSKNEQQSLRKEGGGGQLTFGQSPQADLLTPGGGGEPQESLN